MKVVSLLELDTWQAATGDINAIIETPRQSRNKFKYDPALDLFMLNKVLPAGMVFPFEFGFIPSTLGEDGDPEDVLVLMDEPIFPGNLVHVRLIGAIEADQTEDGKTIRNDRLIAVATRCQDYQNVQELDDLDKNLVSQIEHFFISYNEMENRKFKPLGRPNAKQAEKLLEASHKRYKEKKKQDKEG